MFYRFVILSPLFIYHAAYRFLSYVINVSFNVAFTAVVVVTDGFFKLFLQLLNRVYINGERSL